MILLSDFVIDFLVKKGIKDIFLVSGGGIMYLLDSVGRNKKIRYVANYHEQASATAAEAYARVKNSVGACLVTTGPGGTNAITGVAGAWVDSIPMIVISGQVKRELIADYSRTRQIGPQEINIIDMVKPITKYAVTVMKPEKIKYELEKCFFEATSGRPGPTWINIPLDIQGSVIDEKKLQGFIIPQIKKDNKYIKDKVKKVIDLLNKSERPVIIAGQGVRLSRGMELLEELILFTKTPTLLPFNGIDLLSEDNKYLFGKFGPGGTRCGNFVLQNSDLILSIGASINVASTGFDYNHFGFGAKKIMVNVDSQEIETKKIKIDLPIVSDAKEFIQELLFQLKTIKYSPNKKWLDVCNYWKKKYPSITKEYYKNKKYVNSYVFFDKLSDLLESTDVLTTGIALDATGLYQTFKVKKGQRAFVNKNFGQMGWSLPAAVGANVGNGRKRTVCVTGDGSFMVNVHELETIKHYKLPIKIFVFNNGGYESIRYTQDNLFHGRLVGSDKTTGVSNPDFKFLAKAHSLPYVKINNNDEVVKKIKQVLKIDGPVLCEVNVDYKQKRMPKAASFKRPDGKIESKPLEDMWPFLPEEEVKKNMSSFK
jgi:acetolactate synthase-1/2/3 large subunit